jgi:hypothetical protein
MSKLIKTIRDEKAEQCMARAGIKWTIERVSLVDINLEKGRENRARLEQSMDWERVETMVHDIERGDAFPMTVLMRFGNSAKALPASGNHRLAGYEKAFPAEMDVQFDCYIVFTKDEYIKDMLPRKLNMVEGMQPKRAERIQHALWEIKHYSTKPREAERMWGLPEGTMSKQLRIQEGRLRLAEHGVKHAIIADAAVDRLHGISNENVFEQMAKLINRLPNITTDDISKIVAEVREQKTELAQLNKVGEFYTQLVHQDNQPIRQSERTKYLMVVSRMEKILAKKRYYTQLGFTGEDTIKAIKVRCAKLGKQLLALR